MSKENVLPIGPAFTSAVKTERKLTVEEKATVLADADHNVNGCYKNSPYTIVGDDGVYKAYVREVERPGEHTHDTFLDIVRPVQFVARVLLK